MNGRRIIDVLGTVQGLTFNEAVFAIAGRSIEAPPFYSSGPASVNSNGTWKAEIVVPATVASLEFWPSVATVPFADEFCSEVCWSMFFAQERHRIVIAGPHAAYLSRVGRPVQGRAEH